MAQDTHRGKFTQGMRTIEPKVYVRQTILIANGTQGKQHSWHMVLMAIDTQGGNILTTKNTHDEI